jgi:hypothetical protein
MALVLTLMVRCAVIVVPVLVRCAVIVVPVLVRFAVVTLVAAVKLSIRYPGLALLAVLVALTQHWVPESTAVRVVIVVLLGLTVGAALADAEASRPPRARRAGIVRTTDGRVYRFKQSDVSKGDQRRWAKARYEQERLKASFTSRAAHQARLRAAGAQARVDRAVALPGPKRSTFFRSPDFDKEPMP